jgi:hypothetical protein
MRNYLFFLLLMVFGSSDVFSQAYVYGKTVDSATNKVVALATISNITKGKFVVSDYDGRFTIVVEEGDRLVASYSGYDFVSILVAANMLNDTMTVKLNELTTSLPNATVTAKSMFTRYQIDSMQRRLQYKNVLDQPNTTAIGGPVDGSGFGISLSLDRFSKKEKQKRRAKDVFEIMEESAYVDYRFSGANVSEYTGLKGSGLVQFMNLYRPSYDWLRAHQSDDDFKEYINKQLKAYRKVPGNKLSGT